MLATFETVADRDAEAHAEKLIREGKTVNSESWDGPDPDAENAYLDANGWDAYGTWFLGRNTDAEEETKARYYFPFTSDFKNVDRKGLIAIRSRAAQNDDPSVFEAAGRLIDQYDGDDEDDEDDGQMSGKNVQRICFQRKPRRRPNYSIDQSTGEMTSVSLIQIGEAKGHGMFIDQESLESALEVLGDNLPAYVTHEGAIESDRLLKEVGVFSGFFIEEGKLKAENFKALKSFRLDEPERFRRLFDLADSMPDSFGLSLVFESELVWILEDGNEIPVAKGSAKKAVRDMPSVRFRSIRSADFVDAPAANEGGLFSQANKLGENLMEDEDEKTEDEKVVEFTEEETNEPEVAEEGEGQKADRVEALQAEIEELKATIRGLNAQVEELNSKLSDATDQNEKLSSLVKGEESLAEGTDDKIAEPGLIERFQSAEGAEATNIWKQNKSEILSSLRRN